MKITQKSSNGRRETSIAGSHLSSVTPTHWIWIWKKRTYFEWKVLREKKKRREEEKIEEENLGGSSISQT